MAVAKPRPPYEQQFTNSHSRAQQARIEGGTIENSSPFQMNCADVFGDNVLGSSRLGGGGWQS